MASTTRSGRAAFSNSRTGGSASRWDAGTRGKLKWLEKALATENLQDRIQAGEKVVVFETPVSGQEADSGTGAPKEWKTARAEAGAQ
jgi:hypothetical protein